MVRVFAVIFAAKVCLYYHQTKPKQQYFQYLTLINKWGGVKTGDYECTLGYECFGSMKEWIGDVLA